MLADPPAGARAPTPRGARPGSRRRHTALSKHGLQVSSLGKASSFALLSGSRLLSQLVGAPGRASGRSTLGVSRCSLGVWTSSPPGSLRAPAEAPGPARVAETRRDAARRARAQASGSPALAQSSASQDCDIDRLSGCRAGRRASHRLLNGCLELNPPGAGRF